MTAIEYYRELLFIDHGRLLLVAMDYRLLVITAVYYRLNGNLICRECCLVVVLCCVL